MARLIRCMAVAMAVGLVGPVAARADEPVAPLKVVVHVNFPDGGRQGQGLKNIENILKEVGDDGAEIVVVCHSSGIGLVEKARSDHAEKVAELAARGVKFAACRNTMKQKSIRTEDLIEGVGTVPSGALEVVRKQTDGFAYFRP